MQKTILLSALLALLSLAASAQRATVKLDAQATHQHITGFGGFVCSPRAYVPWNCTAHPRKHRPSTSWASAWGRRIMASSFAMVINIS
jgi:O-glycosyl hydrolase